VRRQQDEEAADLLMQFSASTRQLSLVQKDLVLLRQAWEDALDASVVPSRTARECAELERLLEKLQSDVSQWQLRVQVDGAHQDAADVLEGVRSRDLLAEVAYSLDEDDYGGISASSLADSYIAREQRLSLLEDGLRDEAASVRKAAAHVASRDALMAADRERILALTEELKTQQRHLARAIRHTDSSSRGEEDGGFDRDRARTEAPDSYTDSVETPQRGRRDARSAWGFWKGSSPRAAASSRTAATPRPARAAGSPAIIRAASAPDIARHSDFVWEGSQGAQGTPPREDKPTDEEKVLIEQALLLKAEGNARHSAENFEGAQDCYIKAQSRVDKCSSTAAALVCKSCVLTLECVLLLHRVCSLTT